MDKDVEELFNNLESADDKIRLKAFQSLILRTEEKVEWIYAVWDKLFDKLEDKNSYQRSIAIMLLCDLAKSDREGRLSDSLNRLLAHTKDEKFITSRQCIQNIWKVAATSKSNREIVLDHLEKRFRECDNEKHYNLIRQDILQSFKSLDDEENDERLIMRARMLIAEEKDEKFRKTYEGLIRAP